MGSDRPAGQGKQGLRATIVAADPEVWTMDVNALQGTIHPEDDVLAAVRARVGQSVRVPDVGVSALLSHLADQLGVRHAVMLGTAGGVTAAWLLDGMDPRGIVTCIEPDTRRHALMGDAVAELGIADHIRLINGQPAETSERLRDGNYDFVVVQLDRVSAADLDIAARLLRVGGMVVVRNAGAGDDALAEGLATTPWAHPVVLADGDGTVLALRDRDPED